MLLKIGQKSQNLNQIYSLNRGGFDRLLHYLAGYQKNFHCDNKMGIVCYGIGKVEWRLVQVHKNGHRNWLCRKHYNGARIAGRGHLHTLP
jgi:hypothetical protein